MVPQVLLLARVTYKEGFTKICYNKAIKIKDRILKAAGGKIKTSFYMKKRLLAGFSEETLWGRREWSDIFQVLKKNPGDQEYYFINSKGL